MASMDIQRVSSSYNPTSSFCWKNDVFLSFRGEDTRLNFISHLYHGLIRAGIHAFKDDKELERGKCIRSELFQAIEESRFLIIVFSKNYASSTWCLDELFKIAECINTQQQIVIPIFYYVDPSIVRKQIGEFQEVFEKHEERFKENKNMVQKWREAMKKVADISGYDLKNRNESEVIQEIVDQISKELNRSTSLISDVLVGFDSRLEEFKRLIGAGSDVRMIGIHGMGGIGKTTSARVIYNLISSRYEGSSFLANVGSSFPANIKNQSKISKKMISLQKQLLYEALNGTNINICDVNNGINEIRRRLRNKKVLVVIDDVTHVNQLRDLARERDWFGRGSRIIITTRDKSLLHGVDAVYEAELLNYDDALQLFCLNAFGKHKPPENFVELSKSAVQYSCHLPLALEVLGCYFYGKKMDVWKEALVRLSKELANDIINSLEISYEGLGKTDQKIFLDIACFFNGKSCGYVKNILHACDFEPTIGINTLIEKHLIKILDNDTLWMHDLLQRMGREIVKRESPSEPGRWSRLWEKNDICHVFINNTATKRIEGIMSKEDLNLSVAPKAFSKMINLRLLQIKNVQLPGGLDRLSNNLRLLKWHGYPLKSLPSSLELDKVVELKLHHSNIELLWNGIKQLSMLRYATLKNCHNLKEIPNLSCAPKLQELYITGCTKLNTILPRLQVPLEQLTSLSLEFCQKLMEIPDLGFFPNLRELSIKSCPTLRRIHSPFLVHENLQEFYVIDCSHLEAFPSKIHMKSLRCFILNFCPKVENFPEIAGSMNLLKTLSVVGTTIGYIALPDGFLTRLERFNLAYNHKLATLPSTLSGLASLSEVSVNGFELENLPESLGQVESLRRLDLFQTTITQLTSSIFLLKNLEKLSCHRLMQKSLDATALMLPSLSGSACYLKKLHLSSCNLREDNIPCDFFPCLVSLEFLDLSGNDFVSLPITINCLSKLRRLWLNRCESLRSVTELPQSTYKVKLNNCCSLGTVSDAFKVPKLECINCFKLLDGFNWTFSMLKNYLKGPKREKSFKMVAPGDEIPEWVKHHGEGSSITMERPSLSDNNRLVGVVACCVFVLDKNLDDVYHYPHCSLSNFDKLLVGGILRHDPTSEHVLLRFYDAGDELYGMSWDGEGVEVSWTCRPGVEVKKCGAHPIYEQDLNDFNATRSNWWRSSLGHLNEYPEEYFTASQEPSDSDGDGPQPKRFKSV